MLWPSAVCGQPTYEGVGLWSVFANVWRLPTSCRLVSPQNCDSLCAPLHYVQRTTDDVPRLTMCRGLLRNWGSLPFVVEILAENGFVLGGFSEPEQHFWSDEEAFRNVQAPHEAGEGRRCCVILRILAPPPVVVDGAPSEPLTCHNCLQISRIVFFPIPTISKSIVV